jgi:hypothetical protein
VEEVESSLTVHTFSGVSDPTAYKPPGNFKLLPGKTNTEVILLFI